MSSEISLRIERERFIIMGSDESEESRIDSGIMLSLTNFSIPVKEDDHKEARTEHFAEIVHHRATLVRLSGRAIWV